MKSIKDVDRAREILEKIGLLSLIREVKEEWRLEKIFISPAGGLLMDLVGMTNNLTIDIWEEETPQENEERWGKYGFAGYKTVFALYGGNVPYFYKIQQGIIVKITVAGKTTPDEFQKKFFGANGTFINPTMYDEEKELRQYNIVGQPQYKAWGKE